MTYSALNPETRKHDIGIAAASDPVGPFEHKAILVRAGSNRIGVIDTTVFFDRDGAPYLIYTEEEPRRIVLRRMAPDLLSVSPEVTELVKPDRPYERGVTEAPTLILRNGTYHLFFSVGWFQSNKADACYAVCHAQSRSLNGPYVKSQGPILATVPGKVYGPGHQCIVTLPNGRMWMAYHGWDDRNEPRYGSNPVGRTLRIDPLNWRGDTPYMKGPTTTAQPAP
jgi:beta-xylosidase